MKSLLGYYDTGYEYWVNINDIKIQPSFAAHKIGESKFDRKVKFYFKTGEFESPILLRKDFTLVDGYSSYVIAKKVVHLDKVPVYFVD